MSNIQLRPYQQQFIQTLKLRKKEYDFSILESAN